MMEDGRLQNYSQTLGGPILETTARDIAHAKATIANLEGVLQRFYSEFLSEHPIEEGKRPEDLDASNDV